MRNRTTPRFRPEKGVGMNEYVLLAVATAAYWISGWDNLSQTVSHFITG